VDGYPLGGTSGSTPCSMCVSEAFERREAVVGDHTVPDTWPMPPRGGSTRRWHGKDNDGAHLTHWW
jgi:hypothetical protein